ncbi:MAG TPA: methylated-DNA--[protein]-cysteine S-methyltransferase [Gammaproteobacteria bacterium]
MKFLSAETPLFQGAGMLAEALQREIAEYFRNPAVRFQLPLSPVGTPFQRRVWKRLQSIPAGTTLTYGALARELASGARAVAAACRANPIPLLIPCHRVVAQEGVGGYMGTTEGEAVIIKQWLLQHEGVLR